MNPTRTILPLTLFSLTLAACDTRQAPLTSSLKTVFEADDRELVTDLAPYPLNAIGRLEGPNNSWCTASLVWHNIILTNAHCVTNSDNGGESAYGPLIFKLGLRRDGYTASANVIDVWKGTIAPLRRSSADFALAVLDRSLAAPEQWFDIDTETVLPSLVEGASTELKGGYALSGYTADLGGGKVMVHQENCSLLGEDPKERVYLHNCDTFSGSSGSPIYSISATGRARLVALNSAEKLDPDDREVIDGTAFEAEIANLAVKPAMIQSLLTPLRERFPAPWTTTPTTWNIKICNDTSDGAIFASLAWASPLLATGPVARGWWKVIQGECRVIDIAATPPIYGLAGLDPVALDETKLWPEHRDKLFCVNGTSAYDNDSDRHCRDNENSWYRQYFGELQVEGNGGTFIWTIK